MATDGKDIGCGCSRIGCIICKAKLKEKTVDDFNQTVDKIKNFVGDLLTIAQFKDAAPRSCKSPCSTSSPSTLSEKSLALAHSRIEDLKQQNEMLRRKIINLEKLSDGSQPG
jgi:lipoate-protein ligase A